MIDLEDLKNEMPPGYTELREWIGKHPDEELVRENIRWVQKNVQFVFDAENPEYLEYLAKCKEDSKALECALRDKLREIGLPIWVMRRPRRNYAKDFRRMSFLIRPPYFPSDTDAKKDVTNRMQTDDNRDDFILHFHESHVLQQVRWWFPKDMDDSYNSYMVRGAVCVRLKDETSFFQENYGDWEVVAEKICEILVPIVGRKR